MQFTLHSYAINCILHNNYLTYYGMQFNKMLDQESISGEQKSMNIIFEKCKNVLRNYYGSQFQELFLYGSIARHQSDSMSDIDMLVVLQEPFNYFNELRRITELLYPIQLESEQLISVKPAPKDEFEIGSIQLYRNAKSEGVAL